MISIIASQLHANWKKKRKSHIDRICITTTTANRFKWRTLNFSDSAKWPNKSKACSSRPDQPSTLNASGVVQPPSGSLDVYTRGDIKAGEWCIGPNDFVFLHNWDIRLRRLLNISSRGNGRGRKTRKVTREKTIVALLNFKRNPFHDVFMCVQKTLRSFIHLVLRDGFVLWTKFLAALPTLINRRS